ncbi:hypothetical protein [Mesorhizobium sp. B2-5-7]|uniref:hypothetical protein n=1 Tax=Mesorhizobium sp. B2-5-7 TaxID=2589923 RepID=UPI001FEFBA30|nr:hypothetical protein [Mesorhizobium sp. B2-5-7]
MSSFKRALALGAGTVLVLGLLGGYVKNRLWLAESTICLILGAVLGPMGLGWADLASLPLDPFALLKEAARLTLGISVMAAALRLPPGFVARRAAGLALLFVTLPALLVAQAPVEALSEWLTQVLLWQTIGSISIARIGVAGGSPANVGSAPALLPAPFHSNHCPGIVADCPCLRSPDRE